MQINPHQVHNALRTYKHLIKQNSAQASPSRGRSQEKDQVTLSQESITPLKAIATQEWKASREAK